MAGQRDDGNVRARERGRRTASGRAAHVGTLMALALAGSMPAVADDGVLQALIPQAAPLVLKDGRLARISIHAIPFDTGAERPSSDAAAAVTALARTLATDCFLTAQAIGHVLPGTPGDGEILAAHRVARARAEQVQRLLAAAGLPTASIASVWDWQFMVQEPRVTLWVFQLNQGDGCEGAPLDARTARLEPPAPQPQADRPQQADGTAGIPPPPAAPADTVQTPATPPTPLIPPDTTAQADTAHPVALAEIEPAAPPPGDPLPGDGMAAEPVLAYDPAGEPLASTEIVFDANSSFFPRGAGQELKRLVGSLPRSPGFLVEVLATVSEGGVKDASPTQATRYNRWLAERRLGRIADWLEQNIESRALTVKQGYIENDSSRRVLIRIRPPA